MEKDTERLLTLEETFETVLHEAGVDNSGELAGSLLDAYKDWVENVYPSLWAKAVDDPTRNEGDNL